MQTIFEGAAVGAGGQKWQQLEYNQSAPEQACGVIK